MATRGSALSRAVRYFKEADIEEALYVHQRASEIVKRRLDEKVPAAAPKARRPRRTKAQIAADTAQAASA